MQVRYKDDFEKLKRIEEINKDIAELKYEKAKEKLKSELVKSFEKYFSRFENKLKSIKSQFKGG